MRVRKNKTEWIAEQAYIVETCTETRVPACFRHDEECFFRYVAMQSEGAYRDGFPAIAGSMRKAYNARGTRHTFPTESLWGV